MTVQREPRHVGIIMDGNRRWARKHLLQAWQGHERGAELLDDLLTWTLAHEGIREVTLYALSIQNLARSETEVEYLLSLLRKELARLQTDERIMRDRVRIRFVGRHTLFPDDIRQGMQEIEERTATHERLTVHFAVGYGGREEIVDAAAALAASGQPIDEQTLQERLWVPSDLDLVIRTGGDTRTSNFLIWQGAYSEWVFLDTLWPEFTQALFDEAIAQFARRDRRFGQ